MKHFRYTLMAFAFVLILLISLSNFLAPGLPSEVSYDPLTASSLSCSEFFSTLESRYTVKLLLTSFTTINTSAPGSVLVSVGPTENFSSDEKSAIVEFVNSGGTFIFIADNDSAGRDLSYFSFTGIYSLTISSAPLRDYALYEKRPDFVLLDIVAAGNAIFENVSSIITNYPAALVYSEDNLSMSDNNRVLNDLAWSSAGGALDLDKDGERGSDEPTGTFSVIAKYSKGKGYVVVISDPGIFVNDMIDRANNRQFAISLFNWATNNGSKPVVFDVSHGGFIPPNWIGVASYGSFIFNFLVLPLAIVFVAAFLAGTIRKRRVARKVKVIGHHFKNMDRYSKAMNTSYKKSINDPLMVFYEEFLLRCYEQLKLKSPEETELLKKLKAEYPEYYSRLRRTIELCGQVRVGARDIRSPRTVRKMIEKMSDFEKAMEARK